MSNKKEKANLRFVDKCLFSEDKRISDASFYMLIMLLDISAYPEKYAPEEIQERKEIICKDLTSEESAMMDDFLLACVNAKRMNDGDAIDQRKQTAEMQMKLKMKGNDK